MVIVARSIAALCAFVVVTLAPARAHGSTGVRERAVAGSTLSVVAPVELSGMAIVAARHGIGLASDRPAGPGRLAPALALDAGVLVEVDAVVRAALPGGAGAGPDLRVLAAASWADGDVVAAAREDFTLPDHYAWVERDTRSFWFAAGAGAAATLATHLFVGLPVLVAGFGFLPGFLAATPVATVALALGATTTYLLLESALSALVGTVVFSATSETYDANYLAAFGGHFAGNILAAGVTGLTFGGGVLLLHGAGLLAEFTAGGGISSIMLFSLVGAMPGVVVAGIALVVVPALVSSWAVAVTATPKPGYAIDDDWRRPTAALDESRRSERFAAVGAPLVTFSLPVP